MPKKRGRKKKFRLNLNLDLRPDVIKSISAVVLFLIGSLILISLFTDGYMINRFLKNLVITGFGFAGYLIPIILLLLGTFFVDALSFRFKSPWVLSGLIGFLFSLSGILALFCGRERLARVGAERICGGLVGAQIFNFLVSALSIYGAIILLFSVFLISFMLVSSLSINQALELIKKAISRISGVEASDTDPSDEEDEEDETTLGDLIGDTESIEEEDEEKISNQTEPRIEVLPSFSEPQGEVAVNLTKKEEGSLTSIAPTLPYADKVWQLPPLSLLDDTKEQKPDSGNVKSRIEIIESTLKSFGIDAKVEETKPGPSVTQYALRASRGTKISKIVNLQYDLALALASPTGSVRIEAPIPGRSLVGIEVPNNNRVIVPFRALLTSDPMKNIKSKLGIVLGKDVGGKVFVYDIGKMPHLLVAGATGSGKSVFLHSSLFSVLFRATPQEVKFILVDPKRVEFTQYEGIPHLLTPVVTDIDSASSVFKWAVSEMERRYKLFENAKTRNINSYNEKSGFQALPYIMIVVDELGEIMVSDPAGVEKSIIRLAQLARATGVHLVLSVQRPSTNVITGLIKANIPCRVAFNVSSQVDSRVIIDQPGAEKLLGKGDMLFVPPDASKPTRLQGAMVTEKEVADLVNYLKDQGVEPDYKEEVLEMEDRREQANTSVAAGGDSVDELFDEAVEVCITAGRGSASLLQRRLSIGYARAARILDELEAKGVVGPRDGSRPRELLIDSFSGFDEESEF